MSDCDYNRDCSKVPIPGRCLNYCLERILRTVTVEEILLILGPDEELSSAIYNAYNRSAYINSFQDLQSELTDKQLEILSGRFAQMNQFQLDYFRSDKSERESVIQALKKMRFDTNNDFDFALEGQV